MHETEHERLQREWEEAQEIQYLKEQLAWEEYKEISKNCINLKNK